MSDQPNPSLDPTPSPKPGRKSNWPRVLLFSSLALNLLVVGMVAGAMVRHDRSSMGTSTMSPLRELGYGPFSNALSPPDKRAISMAMMRHEGDLRANRAELRTKIETLLTALRASPYRPEVVRQLVEDQQAKLLERQDIGQRLLLEQIEMMNDHERAAYARRLERALRRLPGPDRNRRSGG